MKYKYLILKNDDKNELIIKEFVELEKHGDYSLAYEETYDSKAIISAISKGKEALTLTLRTTNFYPLGVYAIKIAASVMNLYSSENNQSVELIFNDMDLITKDLKKPKKAADVEEVPDELDELPGGDMDVYDELLGDENIIKSTATPIQVAEDESNNIKEDG